MTECPACGSDRGASDPHRGNICAMIASIPPNLNRPASGHSASSIAHWRVFPYDGLHHRLLISYMSIHRIPHVRIVRKTSRNTPIRSGMMPAMFAIPLSSRKMGMMRCQMRPFHSLFAFVRNVNPILGAGRPTTPSGDCPHGGHCGRRAHHGCDGRNAVSRNPDSVL